MATLLNDNQMIDIMFTLKTRIVLITKSQDHDSILWFAINQSDTENAIKFTNIFLGAITLVNTKYHFMQLECKSADRDILIRIMYIVGYHYNCSNIKIWGVFNW